MKVGGGWWVVGGEQWEDFRSLAELHGSHYVWQAWALSLPLQLPLPSTGQMDNA